MNYTDGEVSPERSLVPRLQSVQMDTKSDYTTLARLGDALHVALDEFRDIFKRAGRGMVSISRKNDHVLYLYPRLVYGIPDEKVMIEYMKGGVNQAHEWNGPVPAEGPFIELSMIIPGIPRLPRKVNRGELFFMLIYPETRENGIALRVRSYTDGIGYKDGTNLSDIYSELLDDASEGTLRRAIRGSYQAAFGRTSISIE